MPEQWAIDRARLIRKKMQDAAVLPNVIEALRDGREWLDKVRDAQELLLAYEIMKVREAALNEAKATKI